MGARRACCRRTGEVSQHPRLISLSTSSLTDARQASELYSTSLFVNDLVTRPKTCRAAAASVISLGGRTRCLCASCFNASSAFCKACWMSVCAQCQFRARASFLSRKDRLRSETRLECAGSKAAASSDLASTCCDLDPLLTTVLELLRLSGKLPGPDLVCCKLQLLILLSLSLSHFHSLDSST